MKNADLKTGLHGKIYLPFLVFFTPVSVVKNHGFLCFLMFLDALILKKLFRNIKTLLIMKTAKLLKIAIILCAIFTFSACEEENITLETRTGGILQETAGAD